MQTERGESGMKRFVSAGHICLDITPAFPEKSGATPQSVFRPGRLTQVGQAAMCLGGSVGNAGLAMKKIGLDVTLLGKVGDDAFGRLMGSLLAEWGAGGLIVDPASDTGYTLVLAVPGSDRIFLHNPGANDTFTAEDIPWETIPDAAVFHFGYPTLMRRMHEDGGEGLLAMFRRAKAQETATSLDLTSVDPASPAGKTDWQALLTRVLPETDFFVPSYEELCFMLDREKWATLTAESGDPVGHLSLEKDVLPLARHALSLGCAAALIKCGTAGMALATADRERLSRVGKQFGLDAAIWQNRCICMPCFHAPRVRSESGAGDSSIAAFLAAAAEGRDPEDCVRLAAAEGAMAVTEYEAAAGVLPLAELEKRIRAGWPVN